nr:H-NS histone family protein [Rhodovulum imhoffii]
MNRQELVTLKTRVEKALASLEARRREEARKAAEEAAREYGFSLPELLDKSKGGKGNALPKYRNPKDLNQTWTGRGRQPAWFKDAIRAGTEISDMEI